MTYERKIDFAIKLLREIPQDGPIEISYSGGKDSDVILRLAQMAGIPHEAIYKQTSIDPPGTTAHAKEMGATIIRPKMTFFDIVERKGVPSRFRRFCCEVLKEYKVYDRAVQGVRRDESTKRAKLYKEPEMCRLYPKGGKARVYLPILEWTTEDVARFIQEQGIKCAPVYYDADGIFHPERRLGCIGCPLKSDCGRSDFVKYPKFLKEYIRRYQIFLDTHPKQSHFREIIHNDAYYGVFYFLFSKSTEEYLRLTDGLLPDANINPREYLRDYFKFEL